MRPIPSFDYHRPSSLRETLELLQLEGARPLAGGTDLLILLREGSIQAKHIIDLSRLEGLKHIQEAEDTIHIGALVTHARLVGSGLMAEKAPVVREAAMSTGGVQIRNMATIGGNLCNASPAADAAPPLLVLDAEVAIASLEEVRSIPLATLFAGPKMNSLRPGELLTEIRFRVPLTRSGASFYKLGRRRGMTLSLVNAAAYVNTDGSLCQEARVALGSVAPTPIRVPEVEEMLKGERLSQRLIEEAALACRRSVAPVDDIRASAEYRREMACVLTKRALNDAWVRARGSLH